jgi:hypothetical protein
VRAPAVPAVAARDRAWGRTDWSIAGAIVAVPAVVLSVAALAGYPLITGDDLAQNYPLEAFSGQVLRHGHLPLFDGYLWSGTPLLGGVNAHALLPITLLFAVIPPLAAWIAGEVAVLAGAAIGCQVFLRRTGCSPVAAGLGAASFGLGGFVSAQIVHIDFAAAAAALGWMLVALHGLATRRPDARRRHALLLAGAAAWICLCGSPDIVIDAAVAGGAYVIHLLLQPDGEGRRQISRPRLVAWAALGVAAGVAVGALQWLPATEFVSVSQRAHPSFSFISGGSLTPANFLELLVPHVRGGGVIGLRNFAGSFPLAEVDAYPGTLALVAVAVLLARWRDPSAWRWRVWLVVLAASLLIVSGDHTPLEHLVSKLPVVGDQRLPSRALVLFALSASLSTGYFVDGFVSTRLSRRQVAAGLVPLLGVLGVVAATVIAGRPAGGALPAHGGRGWSVTGVLPYLLVSTGLAFAAGALLLVGWRASPRRRALLVSCFVVVDLLLVNVNQSSLAPEYASALRAPYGAEVAFLAGSGRVLVVDPSLSDGSGLARIGAPDLGVPVDLPDAGGYGSLMWGPYDAATGTHAQDGADAAAISNGTFSTLGVTALLTLPSQLVSVASSAARVPVVLHGGVATRRWFGQQIDVSTLVVTLAGPATPGAVRALDAGVRLLGPAGTVLTSTAAAYAETGKVTFEFSPPVPALGVSLGGGAEPPVVTEPIVTTGNGASFVTGGPLAAALGAGGWVEVEGVGGFSAFVNHAAARPFTVTSAGASWSVLSSDPWTGAVSVRVSTPRPASLLRSTAAVPGWRAVVAHGGRAAAVEVRRHGLVQAVAVPAGVSTVTFFYVAPGWDAAQLMALGGALVLAGLVLADLVAGRRRWVSAVAGRRRRLSAAGARSRAPG